MGLSPKVIIERINKREEKNMRYAVVECVPAWKPYKFKKWHDNVLNAKAEAERLTQKERKSFIVIQEIGFCRPKDKPVEWEWFNS